MDIARVGRALLGSQLLLLALAGGVSGQEAREDRPIGVITNLGLGVGSRTLAGQLSLWLHVNGHSVGIRTAGTSDFEIFSPSESDEDFALLYGLRSAPGPAWGRIAVGPAVVRTVRTGGAGECVFFCSYEVDRKTTFGVALQADGVLVLVGPIALGATAFGNINPEASFLGVTLTLGLGRVGS